MNVDLANIWVGGAMQSLILKEATLPAGCLNLKLNCIQAERYCNENKEVLGCGYAPLYNNCCFELCAHLWGGLLVGSVESLGSHGSLGFFLGLFGLLGLLDLKVHDPVPHETKETQ